MTILSMFALIILFAAIFCVSMTLWTVALMRWSTRRIESLAAENAALAGELADLRARHSRVARAWRPAPKIAGWFDEN